MVCVIQALLGIEAIGGRKDDATESSDSTTVGLPAVFASRATVTAAAATQRSVVFGTDTERRWIVQVEETAESGANAGSNFRLLAYDDNDTLIGEVFYVTRSTRVIDFKVAPTINGIAINTSAADITAVTAGTGLSGGGTTGAVTLDLNTAYGAVGTCVAALNNSGGNVAAAATLAGSSLTPAQSGTWRCMGNLTDGGTVTSAAMALWMRIS